MSIHRKSRGALRVAAALGVLVVAVVATSAGSAKTAAPAATKPPFKILVVVPTSGPLGFVGLIETRGLAAGAQVVNKQGGILGSKIAIKVLDGGGDGGKTVSALQQELASGAKYNLIVCGSFGSDAVPCAAAMQKNPALQIPLAGETVLSDPKTYPNVFITTGGFTPNAAAVALKAKRDGVTRIAILSGDNATGHNGADALNAELKKAGITVTSTVFVPVTAADATAQVQQAQASNPQAWAMSGFTPATPAVIKARTKLGLTNQKFYVDAFVGATDMSGFTTADDRKNIWVATLPYLIKGTAAEKAKTFQAFETNFYRYDSKPALSLFAPLVGYNAIMLARGAAEKAKSTDGAKMAKALATIRDAALARGFVGGKKLYAPGSRFTRTAATDYVFVKAGVMQQGLLVPDK